MRGLKKMICLALAAMLLPAAATAARATGADSADYLYFGEEYALTEGQINILKRARQLMELEWSPIIDRYQWGGLGVFFAGNTYTGAPYGQPVKAKYIGFDATPSEFLDAVEDGESEFYTVYSQYNKIAPYYSIDCSGFVSYAWGLPERKTTRTLTEVADKVEEQDINALEAGDCLDRTTSHAVLVGGVERDGDGNVIAVEIFEETPVITRVTRYGDGGEKSLDSFNSYYFGGGYELYRYPERDTVEYTHDCAAPIDADYCENCRDSAPRVEIVMGADSKTVYLTAADGCTIYYTTDGSAPTEDSSVYEEPIELYESVMLRAIAVSGMFSGSRVLSVAVSVEPAAAPYMTLTGGLSSGDTLSYGSTFILESTTPGAVIYYTTDGEAPLESGEKFTSALTATQDMSIRAVAVADGFGTSEEARFTISIGSFSSFDDVPGDAWYGKAVSYVRDMGLFNGTGDGRFSPDGTMTRGMFVTALGRMAGIPDGLSGTIGIVRGDDVNVRSGPDTGFTVVSFANTGDIAAVLGESDGWYRVKINGVEGYIISDYFKAYDGYFTDLSMDAYYSPYVQWVYLTGVSDGLGMGSFGAESEISRQSMAAMLYQYNRLFGTELKSVNDNISFTDDGAIAAGARDAVYALGRAGVISGMGDGSFSPDLSATRAQVAQIFMNYMMAVR